MFVQFIEGQVSDADALRRQHQEWIDELAEGAEGYLGSTGGVTEDGRGFLAARFESAEAAAANADRPEQDAWWQETRKSFEGEVEFVDCDRVHVFLGGGTDDAGFVQVIRGQVTDGDKALELLDQFEETLPDIRPEVLGGYAGLEPDGSFTEVVYFTSEEDAHAGEQIESDELDELNEQFGVLQASEPRFLDLPEPWLHTA